MQIRNKIHECSDPRKCAWIAHVIPSRARVITTQCGRFLKHRNKGLRKRQHRTSVVVPNSLGEAPAGEYQTREWKNSTAAEQKKTNKMFLIISLPP